MFYFDSGIIIYLFTTFVLTLAGFAVWLQRRKKKKGSGALILSLCLLCLLVYTLGRLVSTPLGTPFFIIQEIVAAICGVLLVARFFPEQVLTALTRGRIVDYASPAVLEDSVSKILDSDNFLTALRTALPKGKEDERFGFDFIPFMLSSIDERRRRAAKSAKWFLVATVCAALIFSVVVMYFGYILVNEASAGTAKTLADIRTSMESTAEALHAVVPSYFNNPVFQQSVAPKLERLEHLDAGEKNRQVREKIAGVMSEVRRTGNFIALDEALSQMAAQANRDGAQEKSYSEALDEAKGSLTEFLNAQNVAVPELNSRVEELKVLIPKAEDSLGKPENRVPEIIKRLALGVVIATFFLALLRYLGTLYRTRYQQVVAAENDDFMVRRFYVAFKSSTPSDEQRKAVLSSFMTVPTSNSIDGKDGGGDGAKQEYEILKELLGALSKKL